MFYFCGLSFTRIPKIFKFILRPFEFNPSPKKTMSEQRQLFRFRFPWASSAPPAPRTTNETPPPPPPPPPPASPPRSTSVSTIRPPFRSSVSQPSSPRGGSSSGSSVASQPPPPPPGNVSTFHLPLQSSASQPSSPHGSTTGSGVASQPSSLPQASSLPSSPVQQIRIASSASLELQKTQETTIPESSSIPEPKPPSEPQIKTATNTQVIPDSQKIYSIKVTSQPDDMKTDSAKTRDVHPNPEPEPENLPQKAKEEKKPTEEFLKKEKAKAHAPEESKKQQESHDMKKPDPNSKSPGLPHSHHEGNHRVRDSQHKFGSWKVKQDHALLQKEIKEDTLKLVHNLTTGKKKFQVDDSDCPVHVITVAGENTGASMYLSSDSESAKKDAPIHIHRGYKTNPDESIDTTTDVDDTSKRSIVEPRKPEEEATPETYVNSNVQSVNNAMVFESSISERNPGVEILRSIGKDESIEMSGDKVDSLEKHRAEFNPTKADKLTYQPNIRRRCLGGLFLESSDSEPDNPDKPRRHGCQYGRWERSKDKDVDVL